MKNKNLINQNEAILSGYIRFRPINKTYYLMINSRRLCNELANFTTKVKISRDKDFFILNKNSKGNILKLRKKELVTCISGNNLLTKVERKTLNAKETKFSFPVKVKLFPNEFSLDKYSLYPDQDAAKLGRSLESKGIKLPKRLMTPKAFNHDLEFNYNNKKIVIEITQTNINKIKTENLRHQSTGSVIRAHIFDIYRRCVNAKLSHQDNVYGFIILKTGWDSFKHITDLIREMNKINCYILFTDFDKEWPEKCSEEILSKIKNE